MAVIELKLNIYSNQNVSKPSDCSDFFLVPIVNIIPEECGHVVICCLLAVMKLKLSAHIARSSVSLIKTLHRCVDIFALFRTT